MKRFLKWAGICLGSLFVLLILAIIVLPRVYKEKIRVDLEREIDSQVNADVTFSEVSLKLFRHFPNLTLTLHDLVVKGKDEFKHDTLSAVKQLHLEVKLWSLISKREIEIKS